jgi:hypothetical protein
MAGEGVKQAHSKLAQVLSIYRKLTLASFNQENIASGSKGISRTLREARCPDRPRRDISKRLQRALELRAQGMSLSRDWDGDGISLGSAWNLVNQ